MSSAGAAITRPDTAGLAHRNLLLMVWRLGVQVQGPRKVGSSPAVLLACAGPPSHVPAGPFLQWVPLLVRTRIGDQGPTLRPSSHLLASSEALTQSPWTLRSQHRKGEHSPAGSTDLLPHEVNWTWVTDINVKSQNLRKETGGNPSSFKLGRDYLKIQKAGAIKETLIRNFVLRRY